MYLHVVDHVLGASAVSKSYEGAASAGRRGDGLNLARARKSVAKDLLSNGVIDASNENRRVAGVCRVGSGLTCK